MPWSRIRNVNKINKSLRFTVIKVLLLRLEVRSRLIQVGPINTDTLKSVPL